MFLQLQSALGKNSFKSEERISSSDLGNCWLEFIAEFNHLGSLNEPLFSFQCKEEIEATSNFDEILRKLNNSLDKGA